MTVAELRKALESVADNVLVGGEDADGVTAEIQFAGLVTNDDSGRMYFFIRPNGGYPLFVTEDGSC